MDKKLRPIGVILIVLLALSTFIGLNVTVSKQAPIVGGLGAVEYEYYVVAGRAMTPTLPPPASQPAGFTFTCIANNNATSTGYDFGWIDYHGGRDWLYDGNAASLSPYNTNAYVTLNITNNLGYPVDIEDLTAEVIAGTSWVPTDAYGAWFSNFTVTMVDTLDQWYEALPPTHGDQREEVDYYTGTVQVDRDPGYIDWTMGPNGAPRTPANVGPFSLLENDINGDALATGHVAPRYGGNAITVANGATFTDYFGLTLWGTAELGKQVDATVRLRLQYKVPDTESVEEACDVYLDSFYAHWPTYNDSTDQGFAEWSNLRLNGTVHNYGNVPLDVTINVYYINRSDPFPLVPNPNADWTFAMSTGVSIPVGNSTVFGFIWNFRAEGLGIGYWLIKANATATQQGGVLTCGDDGFTCIFWARLVGDVEPDADVDVGDQRKVQLAMFTQTGDPVYEDWNSYPTFTDFDGDGDVDVGDQRKQQLHMFEAWIGGK